jgi:hypothetical protein
MERNLPVVGRGKPVSQAKIKQWKITPLTFSVNAMPPEILEEILIPATPIPLVWPRLGNRRFWNFTVPPMPYPNQRLKSRFMLVQRQR